MTPDEFHVYLDAFQSIGSRHGRRMIATVSARSSESEFIDVEAFIGRNIPTSLRYFLKEINGFKIEFIDPERKRLSTYPFNLFSTSQIIAWTEDFRKYIDIDDDGLRTQMMSCIDFSRLESISERTCFWLNSPQQLGEYAIIRAYLETNDWVHDLLASDRIVIANSFEDFLRRSFDCMLSTERGFEYWIEPDQLEDWW